MAAGVASAVLLKLRIYWLGRPGGPGHARSEGPGGAEMARGIANYVETPAARRRRSLLRLPRRAFIGSLRYGEGRLYTENVGDALR